MTRSIVSTARRYPVTIAATITTACSLTAFVLTACAAANGPDRKPVPNITNTVLPAEAVGHTGSGMVEVTGR